MERSCSPRARKKRSMGGGKNVHRNLYNEEFHYAGLDIPEIVCVCVCMGGGGYIHIYIYIPEYRTACFIDRDKIRLHLPPSLPLPLSCSVHESRHARKFFVGPIFRFAHTREIVFETWAESRARLADRERSRGRNEPRTEWTKRVRRPDNAQRWIIDPQINSVPSLSFERDKIYSGRTVRQWKMYERYGLLIAVSGN